MAVEFGIDPEPDADSEAGEQGGLSMTGDTEPNRDLTLELLAHVCDGRLAFGDACPVLTELLGVATGAPSLFALQEELRLREGVAFQRLAERTYGRVLEEAGRWHSARRFGAALDDGSMAASVEVSADVPVGWRNDEGLVQAGSEIASLLRDLEFVASLTQRCPAIEEAVRGRLASVGEEFAGRPGRWLYLDADGGGGGEPSSDSQNAADGLGALAEVVSLVGEAAEHHERRERLAALLCWAGDEAAERIRSTCDTEADKRYAAVILTLRFGRRASAGWAQWDSWLRTQFERHQSRVRSCREVATRYAAELRLARALESTDGADAASVPGLREAVRQRAVRDVKPEAFVRRWDRFLSGVERDRVLGREERVVDAVAPRPRRTVPPPLPAMGPDGRPIAPRPVPPPAAGGQEGLPGGAPAAETPVDRGPSLWREHVQPLLAANWYMVAGLLMTVAGASLVAYFTWDKHWVWRYTVMPVTLGGLTFGLAELGRRLEPRHEALKGSAAMLGGAAVGLVPVNFMVLCLLSRDPVVPARGAVLAALSVAYLAAFGWGLRRWCAEVHAGLGRGLAWALTLLNGLVPIGAAAGMVGADSLAVRALLPACFYVGGCVGLLTARSFVKGAMTRELWAERRVPCFAGATLAVTFVGVLGWVHLFLGAWPRPTDYAGLVVLLGAWLFVWERRMQELREDTGAYGAEAFAGYAAVLAGVLMSLGTPAPRCLVLLLAGVVWLFQAGRRPGAGHQRTGLVLATLGAASVGLFEWFPAGRDLNLLPVLGLALALGLGAVRAVAPRAGEKRLSATASELQPLVLLLTAFVAVLSQLRFRSAPAVTGATLLVVAGVFAVRSFAAGRVSWLHTGMALVALALPFFGCVDMTGWDVRGNTLALGLGVVSVLWLAAQRAWGHPLLRQTRSSVLTMYGALALLAMAVRVVLERHAQAGVLDLLGPVLVVVALAVAARFSHSLVPGAIAAVVMAVLLPRLSLPPPTFSAAVGWGTGLGSGLVSLGLLCLCVWPGRLARFCPPEGDEPDPFLPGRAFPLLRRDVGLYSIPLLGAGVFLAVKVCTWTLLAGQFSGTLGVRAGLGLLVCAGTWTLVAVACRSSRWAGPALHASWVALLLGYVSLSQLLSDAPLWGFVVLLTAVSLEFLAIGYRRLAARQVWAEGLLATPTEETGGVLLWLGALTAVWVQWRFGTPLWHAATVIGLAGVVGLLRGVRLQADGWVLAGALLLAAMLPYAGCVDMAGQTLAGNTMACGLALLGLVWLLLGRICPRPVLGRTRSLVPTIYGLLAVAFLLLRAVSGPRVLTDVADVAGPLAMVGVLGVAAYMSRSLVPAIGGVVLGGVLLPAFRPASEGVCEVLHWGSGHGCAGVAVLLVGSCLALARAGFLRGLDEGDPWWRGAPFPLLVRTHWLLSGPLAGTAAFLAVKSTLLTAAQLLDGGPVPWCYPVATGVCAVCWVMLVVLLRQRVLFSRVSFHLGWLTTLLCCCLGHRLMAGPFRLQFPLLWTGLVLQTASLVSVGLSVRCDWLRETLVEPLDGVLRWGCLVAGAGVVGALSVGAGLSGVCWLGLFVATELAWRGIRTRKLVHGAVLFLLSVSCALAWGAEWDRPVWERMFDGTGWRGLLWFLLATQLAQLALEWRRAWYERVAPLLVPSQIGGTGLSVLMAAIACVHLPRSTGLMWVARPEQWMLVSAVLLAARAHGRGILLLVGVVLAYVVGHVPCMPVDLLEPSHVGVLALACCGAVAVYGCLPARWRLLFCGTHSLFPSERDQTPWLLLPALALSTLAAVGQFAVSGTGVDASPPWLQLLAPLAALCCYAICGWHWRSAVLWTAAGVMLTALNVDAVAVLAGGELLGLGLSGFHVASVGLIAALGELRLLRRWKRFVRAGDGIDMGCIALSGLVLGLLVLCYVAHPDVGRIPTFCFPVSGLLAMGAGLYFRRAGRASRYASTAAGAWLESSYHLGVALAVWCVLLTIPAFRTPQRALVALGVAPAMFWGLAELAFRRPDSGTRTTAVRFRESATAFAYIVLTLYAFRGAFQMVVFPRTPLGFGTYHGNAPIVLVLGVVLLRLHGLGANWWSAFYGGLAAMGGTYFSVTALPGLSPFGHAMPGAWVGVALVHLFVSGCYARSPVRRALDIFGRIDGPVWDGLRTAWGRCLVVALQVLVLTAMFRGYRTHSLHLAPLLAAAASVLLHQGVVGRHRWYFVAAGVELFVALHMDFLLPASVRCIPSAGHVIWVVLLLWAVLLGVWFLAAERVPVKALVVAAWGLFFTGIAHVFYHGPTSQAGLWAVCAMVVLATLTPVPGRASEDSGRAAPVCLVLASLVWVPYFGLVRATGGAYLSLIPLLGGVSGLLALSFAGRFVTRVRHSLCAVLDRVSRGRVLLGHEIVGFLNNRGPGVTSRVLRVVSGCELVLMIPYVDVSAHPGVALWFAVLWGGSAWLWFLIGREAGAILPNVAGELCSLGLLAVVRHELVRVLGAMWLREFDVWAGLGVSFVLAAARNAIARQNRGLRVSLLATLWLLPLLELGWVVLHGLGTDTALVVLGMHSVIFAYMGGSERESSYNAGAVAGAVAFAVVLFWSRLELRFVHAYVIPVGLGVLGLLQLYGRELAQKTRNGVRMATLVAMLGSTGYYALLGEGYAVGFHLTMILLCLAAMGVGAVLRVRLYLQLGFTGLVVDLAALCYKLGGRLDRTYRMMGVGALLLAVGIALVVGAAYCKTHRDEVEARLQALRRRLGEWE